jgi:hypothetical protein
MSEWTFGCRAALHEIRRLAHLRGLASPELRRLLDDIEADAIAIERKYENQQHILRPWADDPP